MGMFLLGVGVGIAATLLVTWWAMGCVLDGVGLFGK